MLQFVTTADGSKTIYNPEVGENYHSRHGALQESQHVFLDKGLKYFLETNAKEKVSPPIGGGDLEGAHILEVGFGTGLNFLLSADYCTTENIQLDYAGIEAYPLNEAMISETGYEEYVTANIWNSFLAKYPSALKGETSLNDHCKLQIANCKLLDFDSKQQYDVIYFDAFASIHQPEMWDETAIKHTINFLKPGGVFVTYAITGNLKRMLKGFGLQVEKAPGAKGKREMLRAIMPL